MSVQKERYFTEKHRGAPCFCILTFPIKASRGPRYNSLKDADNIESTLYRFPKPNSWAVFLELQRDKTVTLKTGGKLFIF